MTNTATATHRTGVATRTLVLVLGPLATWATLVGLAAHGALTGGDLRLWLWAAALAWSPLPLSIPAVLLDHERDSLCAGQPRPLRAVTLLPAMLFSSASSVRGTTAVSLVAWLLLVAAALAG